MFAENWQDTEFIGFGIADQCSSHEKVMNFLKFGSLQAEDGILDVSLLSDLMGFETLRFHEQQSLQPSLIYPSNEFLAQMPLPDMAHSSKITIGPDGRVLFAGSQNEMNDFLSFVAEFYLSKYSTKWRKPSVLIPHFNWYGYLFRLIICKFNTHVNRHQQLFSFLVFDNCA